jgi:hypothetical protein
MLKLIHFFFQNYMIDSAFLFITPPTEKMKKITRVLSDKRWKSVTFFDLSNQFRNSNIGFETVSIEDCVSLKSLGNY